MVAGGRSRGGFAGSDDGLLRGNYSNGVGCRNKEVGLIVWDITLETEHVGGGAIIPNGEKRRRVKSGVHMVMAKKKVRESRGSWGQKVVPVEIVVVVHMGGSRLDCGTVKYSESQGSE